LPQAATRSGDGLDKALLQALCFGVCRWFTRLDQMACQLLHQPFKKQDQDLHSLLLIGLFQIFEMRIPDHAAISETVEACRNLNKPWATRVMNAALRRATREKSTLPASISQSEAVLSAHPAWMIELLATTWPKQYPAILAANNEQAPLTLRVNLSRISREAYLAELHAAGLKALPCTLSKAGVTLEKPVSVEQLPGFAQGLCSVQDEAAQLAAELLAPKPEHQVLDACAAPGGKSTHLIEWQPGIQLTAIDLEPTRCQRITENLQRLGLNAEVICEDLFSYCAGDTSPRFDRILLDAPCSASGVIRRHPDIKWLRKRSDIPKLAQQQLAMLKAIWPLLKPGGILLYATCSVFPQENDRIIGQFLKERTDASEDLILAPWGNICTVGRQLFPVKGAHDGFYYARLRKHQDSPDAITITET
jgi:16S rRNA (cytosine967-C5)-methyltransferase